MLPVNLHCELDATVVYGIPLMVSAAFITILPLFKQLAARFIWRGGYVGCPTRSYITVPI
jgi:hypothetical protein